jgi:hypothetical protein
MPDHSAEPQVVYHYTSIETLLKIVGSKSIWATSLSYLNDTSEGDHFLNLAKQRIPEFRRNHSSEDSAFFDDAEELSTGFRGRPFIASFSTEPDSLPQWRSYCPNGNGVAIGFSVDCLKRASVRNALLNPAALEFAKVEYIDGSNTASIDQAIIEAINSAKTLQTFASTHNEKDPAKTGTIFQFFLSLTASKKKHKSFSNEHEYRLIFRDLPSSRAIEFRPVRSTLVPYVPIDIPAKRSGYVQPPVDSVTNHPVLGRAAMILGGRWDFIDRVIIGPTPNKALTLDSVSAFFENKSMNVEVTASDVPYRDL